MKNHYRFAAAVSALMLCFLSFPASAGRVVLIEDAILPGGLGDLQAERMLWETGAGTVEQEGFEGLFAPAANVTFDGFSVTGTHLNLFSKMSGNNLITTEGNDVLSFFAGENTSVTFDFDNPITSFGVDITSIDWEPTSVSFSDDLGNTLNNFNTYKGWAGATFFGITNDLPFNQVVFNFSGNDILNFDNLQFGRATNVPEPSLLFCLGLGVLSLSLFRKKT